MCQKMYLPLSWLQMFVNTENQNRRFESDFQQVKVEPNQHTTAD